MLLFYKSPFRIFRFLSKAILLFLLLSVIYGSLLNYQSILHARPPTVRPKLPTYLEGNKMVVLVIASAHYLDFLENYLASVRQNVPELYDKVKIISEDNVATEYIRTYYGDKILLESKESLEQNKAPNYKDRRFFDLVARRPDYLQYILLQNKSVLYTDIDVVWLGNPMRAIPFETQRDTPDVIVQRDDRSSKYLQYGEIAQNPSIVNLAYCTCFLLLQPRPQVFRLLSAWKEIMFNSPPQAILHRNNTGNQLWFNYALAKAVKSGDLSIFQVDPVLVPSGTFYFRTDFFKRHKQYKPLVLHNNWVEGKVAKDKRYDKYNLWFASNDILDRARRFTIHYNN